MLTQIEQELRIASILAPKDGQQPADIATLEPMDFDQGERRMLVHLLKGGRDPGALLGDISPTARQALYQGEGSDLATTLAQRWEVLGSSDLLTPPVPPNYLIQGIVRMPGLISPFGHPGTLKTMLMMDLAVCIAAGIPWLPPLPNVGAGGSYAVKQGPVLWFDMDNGRNRLRERFGALCRARNVKDIPLHAISMARPVFDVSKAEEADLLAAQIIQLGAIFCGIDNLGTVSGGKDENSSEMVPVMANLRYVSEATGATLWPVHHARKTVNGQGRLGDLLRGHTSINASLDLALLVSREEGSDQITVQSTKTRDDPVRPFVAQWTFEKDENGALSKAGFFHCKNVQPKEVEHVAAAHERSAIVASISADGPPNQTRLVAVIHQECELSRNTALAAIAYAVSHGWLVEKRVGDKDNSPLHYFPAQAPKDNRYGD
jgi:hypothetical protein